MKSLMPLLVSKGRQLLMLLLVVKLAVSFAAPPVLSSSEPAPAAGVAYRAASDEVLKELLYLPAPPPEGFGQDEEEAAQKKRPASFYDPDKAPPDDAPAEDLIDYWERWASAQGRVQPKPSDAVGERLLKACEAEPERLSLLLPVLPDTKSAADRVKKLYDAAQGDERFDEEWRKSVRKWLQFNSRYFLDDLLRQAQKARDDKGYVDKEEALKALAKVDWESAAPLLESLSGGSQPRTAAFALALLYRHALAEKDSSTEEKYRARLQTIATDRNAPARARDTAIEELSVSQWTGRDEWYLSLFADETLLEPTDGMYLLSPLTTLFDKDPDRWIPVMAKLVESKDRAVRQNAASCLVRYATDHPRRDAILPVLRWLSDPGWLNINGTQRAWFMQIMSKLNIPESVPGLIWIVENDEHYGHWAARTLAYYKDPRAIPALKKALSEEKTEAQRQYLIEGFIASGGLTVAEQLAAIEAYLSKLNTAEGRQAIERYVSDDDLLPLPVSIGRYLVGQKEVAEPLVRVVLARAENLRQKNPERARELWEVARGWQAKLVDLDMVRRIGEGLADASTIANALERRDRLRESVGPELQFLAGAKGIAPGVAAVLLADDGLAQNILGTGGEQTQVALLACARLVQMPLPVTQVGVLLKSKSGNLSLAAERYLLAEDSPEARQLLWEHHPQQAFVTGWRENVSMIGASDMSAMERAEAKLRTELFRPEDAPLEIFALLGNNEQPLHVLRVYAKRAVYTHYEDAARYRERIITGEELDQFKNFVNSNKLVELGPQFSGCHHDCWVSEFVSLNLKRGRRVFSHQGFGSWQTLLGNFDLLGRGAKIHYRLEDRIKGVEVLLADDAMTVKDVWQRGDDLRVLVERAATPEELAQEEEERAAQSENEEEATEAQRAERRRRERERERARVSWRPLREGRLGAATPQPEAYSTFNESLFDLDDNDFPSYLNGRLAQAVAGEYVVLAGDAGEGGLWKKASGRKAVRIGGEGVYANPLVTPDGEWVVAARTDTDWGRPNDVIRLNLKTRREYRVNLPPAQEFEPIAYVAAHGKVLLRRARDIDDDSESAGPASTEFYLLDAATGQTQLVKGNFEPLLQEGTRFLQATGRPHEFWAAVPDRSKNQTRVGRYNIRDFTFQTLLVVPDLIFDSMMMWVDEAGAKFYVVYERQLLRLPLANLGSGSV